MTPAENENAENKSSGSKNDDAKAAARGRDEVALELMKFIAVTTGYGKGNMASAGFSGKASKAPEEYADALLGLFEKCRTVVAKPVA